VATALNGTGMTPRVVLTSRVESAAGASTVPWGDGWEQAAHPSAHFPSLREGTKLALHLKARSESLKTSLSRNLPSSLVALLLLCSVALAGCKQPAPTQETPAPQASPTPSPSPSQAAGAADAGGGALSSEQLQALVDEARACAQGEACALAGAGTCTCAQPVNASRAAEIDAAAARVECGGAVVRCANPGAARCEAGQCVGVTP
jgi:hypothetical protein